MSSFIRQLKNIVNFTDSIDILSAKNQIISNIEFKGSNVWILIFATVIASVGLNVNSIPVVIGAMLISALMGRENALSAYEIAVKERYRFFSFGDAMLIV
jgi:uncharacterized membrane protein